MLSLHLSRLMFSSLSEFRERWHITDSVLGAVASDRVITVRESLEIVGNYQKMSCTDQTFE